MLHLPLVWGARFEHTHTPAQAIPAWQPAVLWDILAIQVSIHLACLLLFKGVRLSLAVLVLFQDYLSVFPFLIASMSVSGVWL